MIQLDERLGAIAALALDCIGKKEAPLAADIGCDHGQLTAYMLERHAGLRMLASDVSAPSLEKAKQLMARKGLADRVQFAVADGLGALEETADVIIIAGMGAETILKIISEGKERIAGGTLIVQSNVDLPLLRRGLAELGFAVRREAYCCAGGRHYVTMCAEADKCRIPDDRELLLGSAAWGHAGHAARAYLTWQRGVRVREMERIAALTSPGARARMEINSRELAWMTEAMNVQACCVKDIECLVGEIAPYELAEDWDNVGLLVGRSGAPVSRVLVALDLTSGVIDEAKALGAQLIVTHHPIMMSARRRLTDADREGRLILELAQAGIAHIAAHTNLDAAPGGVNDTLMAALGAEEITGEGCVRAGRLKEGMTLSELCRIAEKKLHCTVRAYGPADAKITVLGCCSGAGSSLIAEAKALGADCFVTGEVKHHHALDALDAGVCVIEAGHFETENPVCEVLRNGLQMSCDALKYNVTVFCSKENPFGR